MAMNKSLSKLPKLPKSPGVYKFYDKKGNLLYVGKAASLCDRVKSYFTNGQIRDPRLHLMISQITKVKYQTTDSVLEALILEANLIKKLQPKFNVREKDDKSFVYVFISKEKFPTIELIRETDLIKKTKPLFLFGPFTSKKEMQTVLKIIRKIFPYHAIKEKSEKYCLDYELGLCPGPYEEKISSNDYMKNIRAISMIFQGKKRGLIKKLKKEMQIESENLNFERAAKLRNAILSLKHINDVALFSREFHKTYDPIRNVRIEAYDISNIGGDYATASLVVFKGKNPDKSQYRKFRIKIVKGINDIAMMREVLFRRFRHNWPHPDLIIVDGSTGHRNAAVKVLAEINLKNIPVMAVAKGTTRKKLDVVCAKYESFIEKYIKSNNDLLLSIREEAHRFAIGYHRKLRQKEWFLS